MLFRFFLPLAAAFVAWGLWLADVIWIHDARLSVFRWSALPIGVLIATVSSHVVAERAPLRDRVAFIAIGSCVILGTFAVARTALLQFFAIPMGPMRVPNLGDLVLVALAGLTVCGGLTAAASRFLAPLRGWTPGLLALALILVLPLSAATQAVVPELSPDSSDFRAIALGYSEYWLIHAIRIGYPVFWTALLVPLALRWGCRRSE